MKQTAVDWFFNKLKNHEIQAEHYNLYKEAKEMEQGQIINARIDGDENYTLVGNKRKEYAEQYYNETFNTK